MVIIKDLLEQIQPVVTVGRYTDRYLPQEHELLQGTMFVTSGMDGIAQAAGRLLANGGDGVAHDSEESTVVGLDLGGSEAQALRAALHTAGTPALLILVALQRLGNGEGAHAAAAVALGLRQWGTRAMQMMQELAVVGPPLVLTRRGVTAAYRLVAALTRCGLLRPRTIDPPAIRNLTPAVARQQVRILAQSGAADREIHDFEVSSMRADRGWQKTI
jgi:hypothetical protein